MNWGFYLTTITITIIVINMFLAKVKREKGIPFELKIPNEITANVMIEAKNGINMESVTIGDLQSEFKSMKNVAH